MPRPSGAKEDNTMKKFKDWEVFKTEQEGRDFVKALRLRSYSLTPAAPIWGGAWVLWYNDPRYRRKIH